MVKTIKMSPREWADYIEDLELRFKPAMYRGIVSGAARCIPILHKHTRTARAASPRGSVGAFDTGQYQASWRSSPVANGARVYNLRPYSGVIEDGRRPSSLGREGIDNLEAWAKRKLKLSPAEARNAAWAIAQTLKERPLLARKVMGNAEDEMIDAVVKEITRELDLELGR